MSKDAKNVPALRFKGYSDAWEKRKLGDIFYQVSFFVNPEDAKLELWSLTVAEGLTPKSIRYDRNFLVRKQDKFKVVHSEDFVYNPMNITLGALDQNKLLKSVAVSGYYTTMSINRGFDGSFFKFLLSSPLMIRKYKNYATGSLLEKQRVQFSTFSIINIKAPKFDEQNKIGNFLIKLDHLIAATQDKIDALEQTKRALLQRLFDQSWRFKGYSGSWEKHKLGDLAKRVRGNDGRMDLPILTISAGNGWLTQKERFSQSIAGNELKNYTLLAKNELSYNHGNSKLAKYGAVFALEKYNEALVPRVYHSFDVSGKADSNFIEYLFSSKTPDHELRKLISSGARMDGLLNINYESFMNISLLFPSIEEQQKISGILEITRKLSSETQLILSRLTQIKKALLQKLFI